MVASDAEAIAAGIDFAVICNPSRFHADTARSYVAAGVPVLVEKPISDRCEDAGQLLEESRGRGTPGCMAYCMPYHPAYSGPTALLAGAIGRLLYAKAWFESYLPLWHPWEDYSQSYAVRKDLGGGTLRTLDHEIDFLNWCLGIPETVTGCSRRSGALRGDADDSATVLLGYPFSGSWLPSISPCAAATVPAAFSSSAKRARCGIAGKKNGCWPLPRTATPQSSSIIAVTTSIRCTSIFWPISWASWPAARATSPADLQAGIDAIHVCCRVESNGSAANKSESL